MSSPSSPSSAPSSAGRAEGHGGKQGPPPSVKASPPPSPPGHPPASSNPSLQPRTKAHHPTLFAPPPLLARGPGPTQSSIRCPFPFLSLRKCSPAAG